MFAINTLATVLLKVAGVTNDIFDLLISAQVVGFTIMLAIYAGRAAFSVMEFLRWIKASVGTAVRLIPVEEVLYFQSDEKYTRVITHDAEALIKVPIKDLAGKLNPVYFWQIHRSTIVNAKSIVNATRDFRERLLVAVRDRPEKLEVSRSFAHLFRQM